MIKVFTQITIFFAIIGIFCLTASHSLRVSKLWHSSELHQEESIFADTGSTSEKSLCHQCEDGFSPFLPVHAIVHPLLLGFWFAFLISLANLPGFSFPVDHPPTTATL